MKSFQRFLNIHTLLVSGEMNTHRTIVIREQTNSIWTKLNCNYVECFFINKDRPYNVTIMLTCHTAMTNVIYYYCMEYCHSNIITKTLLTYLLLTSIKFQLFLGLNSECIVILNTIHLTIYTLNWKTRKTTLQKICKKASYSCIIRINKTAVKFTSEKLITLHQ